MSLKGLLMSPGKQQDDADSEKGHTFMSTLFLEHPDMPEMFSSSSQNAQTTRDLVSFETVCIRRCPSGHFECSGGTRTEIHEN